MRAWIRKMKTEMRGGWVPDVADKNVALPKVVGVLRVAQLERPLRDERHAEAGRARGVDAVVHVCSQRGAHDYVQGVAYPHDISAEEKRGVARRGGCRTSQELEMFLTTVKTHTKKQRGGE